MISQNRNLFPVWMIFMLSGFIQMGCETHGMAQDGGESNIPSLPEIETVEGYAEYARIWPEEIRMGDTVYIEYVYDNTRGTENHFIGNPEWWWPHVPNAIRLRDQSGVEWWKYAPATRTERGMIPLSLKRPPTSSESPKWKIPCGEKRSLTLKIQIPPLNAIDQMFWNAFLYQRLPSIPKELSSKEKDRMKWKFILSWDIYMMANNAVSIADFHQDKVANRGDFHQDFLLCITPRNPREHELFRTWYNRTSEAGMLPSWQFVMELYDLRPESEDGGLIPRRLSRYYSRRNSGENFIHIRGEKFEPWIFVGLGNHTPGDPNCPETWEGWKELEESLMPSTMRDEIRLTRMMIQYCDTEDPAVLDELTEWFSGMNEIQRAVMAKNAQSLPSNFPSGYELRNSMEKFIETLQPFVPAEPQMVMVGKVNS
jgi:hypothetical protein